MWSGAANHCDAPGCLAATILAPRLSVTVLDQDAGPLAGVAVYAFSGGEYQDQSAVTDANGVATFVLPAGAYRFRADVGGTQLWSGAGDDCLVPVCAAASITAHFVTVSVLDQAALPLANVPVYLFSGETYLNLSGNTDETGQAVFALPEGAFRFRADMGGTQLWSSAADDCVTPGCTTVSVTAYFVTVLVESTGGTRHAGVPVYLFDGETYLDRSAVTDENGAALFVLAEGAYRFRADLFDVPFWSAEANDCLIPGCLDVTVVVPGAEGVGGYVASTIDYVYDPLNRLTEANYDDETYFHYVYDPVGNRLTEETQIGATSYAYDVANRLLSVAGQAYTWDANGNLLSDGASSYTYNKANRLVGVEQGGVNYAYAYNGTGDRLSQTENGATTNYTLDLAAHLTEVLSDGQSTFVNGLGRIGEQRSSTGLPESLVGLENDIWLYHLSDAIGSVRQVAGPGALVVFAQSYEPYGDVLSSAGFVETQYGFAGEWVDNNGLVYLRARYYNSGIGIFIQPDPFAGIETMPRTYNPYQYGFNNPILYTDPSGETPALLVALLPSLIGAVAGFTAGALAGGIFGWAIYPAALSEQCGCEMQQQALGMTRWEFSSSIALPAGLIGGVAGAIATTGPLGLIIVGGIGVALSAVDLVNTVNIIKNETGITACTVARLLIDVAGIALGGAAIAKGVRQWRASGSGFRWSSNEVTLESISRQMSLQEIEVLLTRLARQAVNNMDEGRGAVYGTRVHAEFARLVRASGFEFLLTEVSYYDGALVRYGYPGAIRVDVVVGSAESPLAIFDLKTGMAVLTNSRINTIRLHLPNGFKNIPIRILVP